ncbi:hypothetical protein [Priestia megaterium]|uniref:hypothetical protein n=1 Tax=Priestia megaterium TaxID=1404 RepID=UPI0012B7085C|nr:hypothetical protein [Priestia megaterium]
MRQTHTTVDVGKHKYILASHHRNKQNNNKSLWTITPAEEVESFKLMYTNNWIIEKNKGWSIHRVGYTNGVLGLSPQNEDVQIAKFVDSSNNLQWHGYPVDYRKSRHDRPESGILKNWVDQGIIKRTDMSKILRGKGCTI